MSFAACATSNSNQTVFPPPTPTAKHDSFPRRHTRTSPCSPLPLPPPPPVKHRHHHRTQVKRGVVPPCPPCYSRKIYGSGPRFMSQEEGSDSEPELVVQPRGHWEKSLGVRTMCARKCWR